MSGAGRETLNKVQEGSVGPLGVPKGVEGPSGGSVRIGSFSWRFGTGQGTLPEVRVREEGPVKVTGRVREPP